MKQTKNHFTKNQLVIGLVGILFILGSSQTSFADTATGEYRYRKTVEKEVSFFLRSLKKTKDRVIVSSNEEGKSSTSVCLQNGNTVEWKLQDFSTGHDITAVRDKNLLKVSGKRKGKRYRQILAMGSKPWFQPPEYSLRPFVRSSGNSVSFWAIGFDDNDELKAIELEATKQGEEYVTYMGRDVLAKKIEVRAEGLMAHFWHDLYWFRKSDNQLLLYKSIHGFPGVATTVLELVGEPVIQGTK